MDEWAPISQSQISITMETTTAMEVDANAAAGGAAEPQPHQQQQQTDAADGPLAPLPFSDDELASCIKVLETIGANMSLIDDKRLRLFRKKIAPLTDFFEGRKYGGQSRKKYLEDKQLREEKRARINQRRMHDKKHINASSLRRERIQKLQSLLEQGTETALPLIADGVAGEDVCHTTSMQALCADDEAQAQADQRDAEKREASALLGFRSCYTCKSRFDKIHHFYDQLCPRCAELNFTKRFQSADMRGKVALVTGARVKIGYQIAVKLLLSGAAVIATSRFPKDMAERFAKHPEYATFQDRLQVFGIDFRDLIHLEQFIDFVLTRYSRLDVIIHNACQTVRRPPRYYQHLVNKETKSLEQCDPQIQKLLHHQSEFETHLHSLSLPSSEAAASSGGGSAAGGVATGSVPSALKSQMPLLLTDTHDDAESFPEGMVDVNGQQIDLRSKNSWLLKLGEVATPEVAEVFAINTLAPFILNNRLVPLLEKSGSSTDNKFIVNVSAMEGKFYRHKTPNHPHTNMAKAALNMMTRTCAQDLSRRRIFMTSVDTGWINDENPLEKAHAHANNTNFQTPIDEIDAAARVLDPVFVGYNTGETIFGKFLKDYHETEW